MNIVFPVRRLSDIATNIDYGVTASASAVETGTKFLRITDIQDGAVDWQTVPFCRAPPSKLRSAQLSDGDIVFARTGATTGKSFLIQSPPDGAVFASYLIRVKPSVSVNPAYLAHFFQSKGYWSQIQRKTQGAAQGGVNATSLSEIEIPLPTLDKQRRIADILDKADSLRRKRKRALDLLDSLTQSIFMEMFGDPIENTKRLPIVTLENVVSPSRKITYGILKPGPDHPGGVPYVRVVDIRNSLIDVAGLKRTTTAIASEYKRSTLRHGDLLISIRGHVGRMAITPPECDGANITQDTARLAITAANTEFVKAQLETDPAKYWMTQRTKGAAVRGINLGDLRHFPLILPPRELQDEFADKIRIVRRMLEKCGKQNDNLGVLFSSLQHRAFSGQL